MKRCPQCNTVFDDSLVYCTNDGAPLVEETFVLPSQASLSDAEEDTVVRREPINIDLSNPHASALNEQINRQNAPPEIIVPVVVEKRRHTGKYLLFLFLGLILGGGLVLAGVLFSVYLSQENSPQTTVNINTANRTPSPTPSRAPTATPVTASAKHEKRADREDDEFNGRVIAVNAYVRSSPSRSAKEVDVLPVDDRLEIEERENENSPWYRVTCEHGTSGWMHGNTIKYTPGDFDFGF
jgi:hypothetical protein